ncbi:hypothetical protein PPACK8108_LOCUS20728 [Phakopsora pachyrhizi]|uniref:DDE Tnp4 domain-containing protein n=1 Tax=Phakopsora pachyrhizi TaxID=170000 RepID=A0AAV0BKN9_PHAPC|nr:hypothetical protein PPACK8108_LOCUS20728 [Phakopsora pachyrhizi]
MDITINSNNYFGPGEYLLADSAYASASTLVPAYRVSNCSTPAKTEFNKREMRNQLRTPKEIEYLTQWVLTCALLHNLLAKIGDKWEELFNSFTINSENVANNTLQTRENLLELIDLNVIQ